MTTEGAELEQAIVGRMKPEHQALMKEITEEDRGSMLKNVKPEKVAKIEGWIGTNQEIEAMLFWVRGGKFDDPAWKALKPADESSRILMEKASAHARSLRALAVKKQKIADLTLRSAFNEGLLYQGLAGAVRVSAAGAPDERGDRFKGVEFRLTGSIDELVQSLTIWPDAGGFEVALGARKDGAAAGIPVFTGDVHSALQLAQLLQRNYAKLGLACKVANADGKAVEVDAKVLRKAAATGGDLGLGAVSTLFASKKVATVEEALSLSDQMIAAYYDRFGLEVECWNIGRKFGNFFLLRDDNFDTFIAPTKVRDGKGLVMLTATLVCRRCRREIQSFYEMAKSYPKLNFALVQLNSPQFKFYERVFGDMGGGNPDEFRKNAAGVTPFIILYKPDASGALKFAEYYGTDKDAFTPEYKEAQALFRKHFGM